MKQIGYAIQFLQEVKAELLKVEWPSYKEWIGATIVSLILVLFFSVFFGGLDRVIQVLVKHIYLYSF